MRRALATLLALLPLCAFGWTSHSHPGGSWDFGYVEPKASPQWCIGLGARSRSGGIAQSYLIFFDAYWRSIAYYVDDSADNRNTCGKIPPGTYAVEFGLYAQDGAVDRNGWGLAFASEGFATYHPWYCVHCWGQP